ncbi:hemolysin D [Vibrio albus]|uniref:Hemolysin D n=1 Tax=Vibrio albus TaxID=2200953 RepID=A0A2U3B9E4_9VIBR|nr:HlyD family secretion protein [Vibrio albus]PWI33402.1 hemolysin D [Vibrio albus]
MSDVKEEIAKEPTLRKSNRKAKRMVLLFVVPLLIVLGSVVVYLKGGRYVETDNAYVKADKTSVTSVVSGRIADVLVEENQNVQEGQLLFVIDPKDFEIAVELAKANLNDVKTSLTTLKAEYQSKLANIKVAQSQYEYLKKEQTRKYNLLKKDYISQSEFDAAKQETQTQKLQIAALNQELKQIAESLGGNVSAPIDIHPKYQSALASLNKAENDLKHTRVYAPDNGVVTKVVENGQYIAPGSLAMMLISDANVWIEANFTETEISHMQVGQQVEVKVDYADDYIWQGKVESMSPATGSEFSVIPAQNATGNWVKIAQRLPVRIRINGEADAPKLRAGLSAVVTVDTQYKRHLSL